MFCVKRIDSLDLAELQPYRTMRRQLEHRQQGIFVAEGEKVVRRLLESRLGVISAVLPEKWLRELEPLLHSRSEEVQVFVAEKSLLEKMTGFSMYQGLLAVGRVPEPVGVEEVLVKSSRPYLLAAVDSLSSAENLGAVVRNCAAFNVQALLVGETCTSPFLRRAVRSSMGTIFELPAIEVSDLVESLKQLRARGVYCIAAHPHASGCTMADASFEQDCCLIFGSEGYGISANVLATCDQAVAIPMPSKVDSLNVASAAAVFLHEATRRRGVVS